MAKIAVILCGSGRGDGSEIQESVSVLIHLARHGASVRCFAPDQDQTDVLDHATGKPMPERRNCMRESARISRGNIAPITTLHVAEHDALVIPGGFGAAKNLCTFASAGQAMTVHPDVQRVVGEFRHAAKPIGLCCIAPIIAAKLLGTAAGGSGVRLTLGPAGNPAAETAEHFGAVHVPAPATHAVTDAAARVVTTPAYMHDDASPYDVFAGIGRMVDELHGLLSQAAMPAR
jgi:enhancing lycopene biosynthesis protein 2